MKKYIDDYFAKQGIRVIYNTLGHTDELVNAYVKETYDMFATSKARYTNAIKGSIYNKFYSLTPREKKTGFEYLKSKDEMFRQYVVPTTFADGWNSPSHDFEVFKTDNESYKVLLKHNLKKIENPLLFYSGGIDSELVLEAFLDIGIEPVVVIFEMFDSSGVLINDYDIKYAYEFCKKNNLVPIVKKMCPESLWDQKDFISLGKELRIGSPQILTHVWMAKIISEEYPNYTYCFGGEIRYKNHLNINGTQSVLVSSAKILTTSGLSGTTFTDFGDGSPAGWTLLVNYNTSPSPGSYWFVYNAPVTFQSSGQYSNNTVPPNNNYEFLCNNVQVNQQTSLATYTNYFPTTYALATPTNSNGGSRIVFETYVDVELGGFIDVEFDWNVRNQTTPGTVQTASIRMVGYI